MKRCVNHPLGGCSAESEERTDTVAHLFPEDRPAAAGRALPGFCSRRWDECEHLVQDPELGTTKEGG